MSGHDTGASPAAQRDFLLAAAAWQDSLLQGYRGLHVTIQGFLIATGSAVLAVQLTGAVQDSPAGQSFATLLTNALFNFAFTALLLGIFVLQRVTTLRLKQVIESRAEDVNHWHRKVMLAENALPAGQRAFTEFKLWQHARRADVTHLLGTYLPDEGLTETRADELIGKGLGHTRRVIDVNLFRHLQWMWWVILASTCTITGWFFSMWLLAPAG